MRYLVLFAGVAIFLNANPKDLTVAAGEAHAMETANLLEVSASDRAILHWNSFSIGANETTRFVLPSIDAAVLNRVTGTEISQLMGLLQSNGQVYLVNPNGVVVGQEGRIDTAAFVASALEMKNEDFLSRNGIAFEGEGGEIVNLGTIETSSGPIALFGSRVENLGTIHAQGGDVAVGAGSQIFFDPTGDSLLYIQADPRGAESPLVSLAIGGSVEANRIVREGGNIFLRAAGGAVEIAEDARLSAADGGHLFVQADQGICETSGALTAHGGEIRLLGEKVWLLDRAAVDVSSDENGGTVLIGGGLRGSDPETLNAAAVYVGPEVLIDADAKRLGDGGTVIVWGNEQNLFFGTIGARGGSEGGNGGFVEISSRGAMMPYGRVTTLAPKGEAGLLLLDPTDVEITAADMNIATFPPPDYTYGAGSPVQIDATNLTTVYLAGGNVQISTAAVIDHGDAGTITVTSPLSWSANILDLVADQDILFNNTVTLSGTAGLTTNATNAMTIGGMVTSTSSGTAQFQAMNGTLDINAAIDVSSGLIQLLSNFSDVNVNGDIAISGTGNMQLFAQNAMTVNNPVTWSSSATPLQFLANGAGIALDINADVTVTSNSDLVFTSNGLMFVGAMPNITITNTGSGVTFFASFSSSLNFGSCTIQSVTAPTFSAATVTNFSQTTNVFTPNAVSVPNAMIRGSDATIVTNSPSFTFPNGISEGFGALGLTFTSTGGDAIFNGTSLGAFYGVTAAGSIQVDNMTTMGGAPNGYVSLNAGVDVTLNAASAISVSAGSALTVQAGRNVSFGDNIMVSADGSVLFIAGVDIASSGTMGTIQNFAASDLVLVVDNNFPNPPDFGDGKFTLPSGFTLLTGGAAKVLLFAAKPGNPPSTLINSFPTTINGGAYTPGSYSGSFVYNLGTNEFLPYWYNYPFPDPPVFEIFFKTSNVATVSPATVQTIQVALVEPVANPPQISGVLEGTTQPTTTPDPTASCRTPPVAVQAL